MIPLEPLLHVPARTSSTSIRVSLPISEAIIQSKENLKRMIIIKVLSGNVSVRSLRGSLPHCLQTYQCEFITPFGEDFILTLYSAKVATAFVKKSPLTLHSNIGQSSISLSHWTLEFGSHAVASGNCNWVRMTNLLLHCWNWNSIVEVLRPLRDLIFVQKREDVSLEHLRALVRLRSPTSFPLVIIEDVGVRSFKVRLEDHEVPILRSKVVQGLKAQLNPNKKQANPIPPS